ncbi:MAG: TetR/AcrR family transcriptional regulator [Vicinamibacterales bacterium]
MATRPDTRTRILAAARAEFAARGFAGARVKTIAARARANKRMLYYYFRSKRRLFDAVLAAAFRERGGGLLMTGDPVSVLVEWYRRVSQAPDLCRLLQWESLEQLRAAALPEARSMAVLLRTAVRNAQGRNGISKEFEPEYAALALVAVTVFPVAFPRLAELLTGVAPETPFFGQKHAGLLRTLLRDEPLVRG